MKNEIDAIVMATIKQGILGGFSGLVGNVVGSSWKSRAVIKSRPLHVHDPKTAKQLLSRARFATVQHLASVVGLSTINAGFHSKSRYMTESNYFFKCNYDAVTGFDADNLDVDYSKVVVAEGRLPGVAVTQNAASEDPLSAHVAWVDVSDLDSSAGDMVRIVALDPEQGTSVAFSANRSTREADVTLPAFMKGHTVHFYLFVLGMGATTVGMVSNSVYAGKAVIA
ncbi:MAG: hypothetical protein IJ789_04550 [Bacteroidales bacterium]|nr:hypothetical protein [Bacteroidales bacterium]